MPYSGSTVDEQVVKMSFDNSNFDGNISDSIKALNNLDARLVALNKENFKGITNGITNLANTFSVKGQIMLGVLTRLGSKIYDLGNRAFRKLTQGIRDGLGEYNQIIDATQTIYQNVRQNGNSIKDVNNALDELNDYADKTIYNFGEMTRMIGMFTSAGVGLKKSTSTIKGLANAAALVGANSQKAQVAWNAVSRAMSSGTFSNITWRSLELSGIAGKQFNKVITEVARANKVTGKGGKNIDQMIKKYGSLRETLREKWLTKDLFNEAMEIMSGALSNADLKKKGYTKKQIKELRAIAEAAEEAATKVKTFKQLMETTAEAIGSGWAQTFRILIGDLEEAKELYTRISDVISDFIDNNAKIRNKIFTQIVNGKDRDVNGAWKTGRDNFKQIIENMMAIVKTFLKSVKTGFLNIFPIERISAAARRVLDVVQKFTKSLVLNNEELNKKKQVVGWDTSNIERVSDAVKNLIRFFRGLAAAVDIAWMAFSQPIKVIIKRVPFLNNFFENTNSGLIGILEKLGNFGDKITIFQNAMKQTNFFGAALEILLDNIDELGKKYPVIGAVVWVFRSLKKVINDVRNGIKKLNIKPISTAFGIFKFIVTAIWRGLNGIFGVIQNISKKLDFKWLNGPKKFISNSIKAFSDYGKGLIKFEDIAKNVKDFFVNTFSKIKESTSSFFTMVSEKATFAKNAIVSAFDNAKKSVVSFASKIKTGVESVTNQFGNVQTAAGQTENKVQSVWDKVKGFFSSISEFFKNLTKNSDNTVDGIVKKIALIAGAVAASAFTISTISKTFGKLRIMSNISTLLKSGVDVIKAYQREAQTKTILNIAIAIGILSGSLIAMSLIPYDKMESGLVVFASFMATIALTLVPLINSIALLNQAIANRKNITNAQAFFNIFRDVGVKLTKGINAKAFGRACIYFAIAIGIIVASIIALKKNFDKIEDIEKPANILIQLMISMGVVIGITSVALTLLSKSFRKVKAVVNVFSSFFQLVGVSHVIISIALSIAILVQSLIALSKIDIEKTEGPAGLIFALMAFMGGIAITVSAIIAQSKNFGKLKDISLVLVSAAASLGIVILTYIALMKMMENSDPKRWWEPLLTFTGIIGQFTAMTAVLLGLSKKVGGKAEYWKQLNKFLIIITACMTTLAGGLYLLSFAGKIDSSILSVIETLTSAAILITILLGILTAISGAKFSTNFLKVIQGLSYAVSAFAAAVGILAIGLTTLINAIDSVDVKSTDSKNMSNKFIQKIEYVATVIKNAIPSLKNLFYSIGQAIAEVFSSFVVGFLGKLAEIGDQFTGTIDKVINLIINIVGKVVSILHSRKEELISIFNKVADLIVSLFTNALNQAFRRGETETPIKESTVSKFLGLGAIFTAFTSFASKLNTLHTFITNNAKRTADFLNKINDKLTHNTDATSRLTAFQYTAMALAVTAALKSVSLAFKGWRQMNGKEAMYIRNDVNSVGEAIIAFLTDAEYRVQALIFGMTAFGRVLIQFVVSVGAIVSAIVAAIPSGFIELLSLIAATIRDVVNAINDMISNLTGNRIKALDNFSKKLDNFATSMHKHNANLWKTIGQYGFANWKNVLDFEIGSFKQASAQAGTEAGKAFISNFNDTTTESIKPVTQNVSNNLFKAITGETDKAIKYVNRNIKPSLNDVKQTVKKETEEIGKNIIDGPVKGINETKDKLMNSLWKTGEEGKEVLNKVWERHSPSKVTEAIYRDVVMGGVVGVKKNKGKLSKEMASMISEQEAIIKAGTGAMNNAILKSLGIEGMSDRIKQLNVDIISQDNANKYAKQTVTLNEKYLSILESQKEALIGRDRQSAMSYMTQQIMNRGLMVDTVQIGQLIDAVLSQTDEHTQISMDQIEQLVQKTTSSVEEVAGKEMAAQQLVIEDAMNDYNEMMSLAEDHKDELINKKKEEVQEYLYQEALKRGMTEETAKRMSEAATEELFKGKTKNEVLTKEELLNKIDAYKKDFEDFKRTEEAKTTLLSEMSKARAALEANLYYKKLEQMRTGQITAGEFQAWMRTKEAQQAMIDYNKYKNAYDNVSKTYYDYMKGQTKDIVDKGLHTEESIKKANEEARKLLGEAASANRGEYTSLFQKVKDLLNIKLPGIDLSPWKIEDPKNPKKPKDTDKDAINKAKDTKKKLEDQRADLTPTFDLDKLSDEAKKANGIVTSSLMAAQNASIGDYINKDSELNPFMKDRWQNVYNFTQNNYSPKALSRTDIYRQTQRQLKLSRGF